MKKLTDIKSDFPGWYQDVISQAELVDSGPTRGSMVIRPYGYAIWENFQKIIDNRYDNKHIPGGFNPNITKISANNIF